MKTIHKYTVDIRDGRQEVEMPRGAKILTAQMQGEELQIWALVRDDAPKETRIIKVVGTGWDADFVDEYIGTVQIQDELIGRLVFHVFTGF